MAALYIDLFMEQKPSKAAATDDPALVAAFEARIAAGESI